MEDMVELTAVEKRTIWISAAVALSVLAILFFVGLFTGLRADNPFLPGFYWIANVIAALSSGILGSTISGFMVVKYERLRKAVGTSGRLIVQGTGGFAVFLLVMLANPQNQMFKLADTLFSSLLSDCEQAARIGDIGLKSNSKESCIRLISLYPLRPEPYAYLARWTHLNKRDDFKEASMLYRKAISLYGLEPIARNSIKNISLSPVQLVHLSEDISSFNFATGDYLLKAFSQHQIPLDQILLGFEEIIESSFILSDKLLNDDSDPDIWARTFDIRGKIYLYKFFLEGRTNTDHLKKALITYSDSIKREQDYPFLLQYHRFVTLVLLCDFEPNNREMALQAFREMLAGWTSYFDARWVQIDRPALKQLFSQIINNERPEPWRVTRVFGSTEFAGREIRNFIASDPKISSDIQNRIRNL